jgi:enamine deaminase RidA (YjgF/YER057c/UK114 family)
MQGCVTSGAGGKKIILPAGTQPGGRYSPGNLAHGTLNTSGQAGEDASGKVPGDFETEVKQALDSIDVVSKAAGMSSADVVSVQIYRTDVETFQQMNAVYTAFFKDPDRPGPRSSSPSSLGRGISRSLQPRKSNREQQSYTNLNRP